MNVAASASLRETLAAEPGVIIEKVAKDHGVTLRAVVDALPAEMRKFAPGEAFIDVMGEVAKWGDVTVIIHTEDGVMEFSGLVPEGKVGQGYYNLGGSKGFHGHLRHDRCAGVGFIERPFFGRPSASILFFNLEGGVMFKVFVGRDEQRNLKDDQLAAFRAIANKVCNA